MPLIPPDATFDAQTLAEAKKINENPARLSAAGAAARERASEAAELAQNLTEPTPSPVEQTLRDGFTRIPIKR